MWTFLNVDMLYTFPFPRLCQHGLISTRPLLPSTPMCSNLIHPSRPNSKHRVRNHTFSEASNSLAQALCSPECPPPSECQPAGGLQLARMVVRAHTSQALSLCKASSQALYMRWYVETSQLPFNIHTVWTDEQTEAQKYKRT